MWRRGWCALGGRQHSRAEHAQLLERAGLRLTRVVPTATGTAIVEAKAKAKAKAA
ncbi:hypothetical protein AB0L71_30595 [Streptomyces sp. NPDC052052]|uniref:hypothetical protein n=1 Tax=Streptomyces sp. NPDC052052 TaxID=3154756 RepID=UPI00342884D3